MTERRATHKCTICGAQWQDLGDMWTLVSRNCGPCCDNAPMGEQIVPLADVMTDSKCAETLAEFRKLTLGPELSAALDHAIGRVRAGLKISERHCAECPCSGVEDDCTNADAWAALEEIKDAVGA